MRILYISRKYIKNTPNIKLGIDIHCRLTYVKPNYYYNTAVIHIKINDYILLM